MNRPAERCEESATLSRAKSHARTCADRGHGPHARRGSGMPPHTRAAGQPAAATPSAAAVEAVRRPWRCGPHATHTRSFVAHMPQSPCGRPRRRRSRRRRCRTGPATPSTAPTSRDTAPMRPGESPTERHASAGLRHARTLIFGGAVLEELQPHGGAEARPKTCRLPRDGCDDDGEKAHDDDGGSGSGDLACTTPTSACHDRKTGPIHTSSSHAAPALTRPAPRPPTPAPLPLSGEAAPCPARVGGAVEDGEVDGEAMALEGAATSGLGGEAEDGAVEGAAMAAEDAATSGLGGEAAMVGEAGGGQKRKRRKRSRLRTGSSMRQREARHGGPAAA